MKISLRILLGYFLIVGMAAWFVLNIFMDEIKPGVRQAMEDTLVDTAQVLARLAAPDLQAGRIGQGAFAQALQGLEQQPLRARVWNFSKSKVNTRVYVTDARGIVQFDSAGQAVGQDFSRWNDVYLTLRGRYGARSTQSDPSNADSTVMHVAAPIKSGESIIGVLTVAKPNLAVAPFIENGRRKIFRAGLWLLGLSLLIGAAVALWITGSLRQLLHYAERVTRGEKAEPPDLGSSELATLSRALAGMREKLEGKQYVERYVHTLTHEMKSPLTAIGASAELLQGELPAADRQRFSDAIAEQADRLRHLVDRMLGLAQVESRQGLQQPVAIDLASLCAEVLATREAQLHTRQLAVQTQVHGPCTLHGDRFLLAQAIANLLDNAIDFSPPGGTIELNVQADDAQVQVQVADRGAGVPEYAQARVFERFYSLERPATGKKSTGLGLPFVREVAQLHGGTAALTNRPDGGAVATLRLPRQPKA